MLPYGHRAPEADLISEVIGDARRAENWTSPDLVRACIAPMEKHESVTFSRYYLLAIPPVVVDFEPARVQGKFYLEAKRCWCHEHGIVYVPIFLHERLTRAQLAARLQFERTELEHARRAINEERGLRRVPVHRELDEAEIDAEALRRLNREIRRNTHLRGASKARRLAAIKRHVLLLWQRNPRKARWLVRTHQEPSYRAVLEAPPTEPAAVRCKRERANSPGRLLGRDNPAEPFGRTTRARQPSTWPSAFRWSKRVNIR
jgi:hypothetical protein